MHTLRSIIGAATMMIVGLTASSAMACRIEPPPYQAEPGETLFEVDVTVVTSDFVPVPPGEPTWLAWRAVGSTTQRVALPLDADRIEFFGNELPTSSCDHPTERPKPGTRFVIQFGRMPDGSVVQRSIWPRP